MRQIVLLYLQGIKVAVSARMAYRADYFISLVIMMTMEMIFPLVTLLIYKTGASFPGWEYHEVFLIQAVFLFSKGLVFPFFAGMVWNTINRIRDGEFDLLLIKPRNILFMSIVTAIDAEDLGKLFGGTMFLVLALLAQPSLESANWLLFILLTFTGVMVFCAFCFFMAGSAFKWVGNFRVYEMFESVSLFGMYPKTIFSKHVQNLISYLIPVALMGFYPASAILGRDISDIVLVVMSATTLFILSIAFWYRMLRTYTSAGG